MKNSKSSFGSRLRTLREKRGLSQGEVAERAGVSQAFISMLEDGKRDLTRPYALAIADALCVKVDELQREEKR